MAKGFKTGGRSKNVPNKKTVILNDLIVNGLNKTLPEAVIELLPLLDPAQQMKALLHLMEYVYPKRKSVENIEVEPFSADCIIYESTWREIPKDPGLK